VTNIYITRTDFSCSIKKLFIFYELHKYLGDG